MSVNILPHRHRQFTRQEIVDNHEWRAQRHTGSGGGGLGVGHYPILDRGARSLHSFSQLPGVAVASALPFRPCRYYGRSLWPTQALARPGPGPTVGAAILLEVLNPPHRGSPNEHWLSGNARAIFMR
jgi:hypothetical protein